MAERLATIREVYELYSGALALSGYITLSIAPPVPVNDTLTLGAAVLTSAGSRTLGGNDFYGAASDVPTDLTAAVNDPANDAYAVAYARVVGSLVQLFGLGTAEVAASVSGSNMTLSAPLLPAPSPIVLRLWEIAGNQIDTDVYGDDSSYAHALLTAHFLSVVGDGSGSSSSTSGAVSKRKIDTIEVTYATSASSSASAASSDPDLNSTLYGRLFLQLQAAAGWARMGVVGR